MLSSHCDALHTAIKRQSGSARASRASRVGPAIPTAFGRRSGRRTALATSYACLKLRHRLHSSWDPAMAGSSVKRLLPTAHPIILCPASEAKYKLDNSRTNGPQQVTHCLSIWTKDYAILTLPSS
jgi:hypothetical protein